MRKFRKEPEAKVEAGGRAPSPDCHAEPWITGENQAGVKVSTPHRV